MIQRGAPRFQPKDHDAYLVGVLYLDSSHELPKVQRAGPEGAGHTSRFRPGGVVGPTGAARHTSMEIVTSRLSSAAEPTMAVIGLDASA